MFPCVRHSGLLRLIIYLNLTVFAVRFIPAWMPGTGCKRQGLEWREILRYLCDILHLRVKNQMGSMRVPIDAWAFATGELMCSFRKWETRQNPSTLLRREHGEVPSLEEEEGIKWCAGGLYAGAGTL